MDFAVNIVVSLCGALSVYVTPPVAVPQGAAVCGPGLSFSQNRHLVIQNNRSLPTAWAGPDGTRSSELP